MIAQWMKADRHYLSRILPKKEKVKDLELYNRTENNVLRR